VRAARNPVVHAVLCRYADYRAPGARTSAIGRTKIVDDVARASDATQLVILGAGFDCRAHRLPELAGTAVFEVDRPETQARKRELLAGAEPRSDVHYVAVDFLRDDTAQRLAAAGWEAAAPTCFVWEGVTNYLTAEAVDEVLGLVGRSAPGSTLVFTYIHRGLLDGTVSFPDGARILANVRALGEPWTFGILPAELRGLLDPFQLTLCEDLGADEYRARTRAGDSAGYAFYRLAIANR
jgi:methyltransferase (TIGR00027 family)